MKENEKEVQRKFMEMEILKQQLQALDMKRMEISKKIVDMETTKMGLDGMSGLEKDNETMVAVGEGVFAMAQIKETDKVIVNVGANLAVKKPVSEVKKLISEEKDKLIEVLTESEKEFGRLNEEAQSKNMELQKMLQEAKETK